jgi:alginate export protein
LNKAITNTFMPTFLAFSLLFILQLLIIGLGAEKGFSQDSAGFSQSIKDHTTLGVNIRLRDEYWNTFEKKGTDTEESYNFFLIRARAFANFSWENFKIHVLVQGVKAFDFPRNGAFGPGLLYYNASGQKKNPGNFQFVEALLQYNNPRGFYFKGGRIPIKGGEEVIYKDSPKLTWVIKNRLSERLIGIWDWTNIGRRFDGGSLGYQNSTFDFNAFGSWVTYGGFDFDDGYWKDLDNVVIVGGSFTLKEGALLDNTQFKLFNYYYFDNRDIAVATAGDDLKINTIGANVVGAYTAGPGEIDLLMWGAFQFGNFGDLDQKAVAFIGEAGYQLTAMPWKPWLRAGIAYASGDGDPNDSNNGTFFNMVPTNHKFYGYADVNAFSNLVDTYLQLFLSPHQRVSLSVDGHLFWLASDDEVWIGGSGPFNDSVFGYAFRSPVQGNDIEKDLGGEIDLGVNIAALDFLSFQIGYSHFFGGSGVGAVFDKKDDLDWFYAQSVIHF